MKTNLISRVSLDEVEKFSTSSKDCVAVSKKQLMSRRDLLKYAGISGIMLTSPTLYSRNAFALNIPLIMAFIYMLSVVRIEWKIGEIVSGEIVLTNRNNTPQKGGVQLSLLERKSLKPVYSDTGTYEIPAMTQDKYAFSGPYSINPGEYYLDAKTKRDSKRLKDTIVIDV